jgi:ribosomal protein S18 acetylase RimI-like enzyme
MKKTDKSLDLRELFVSALTRTSSIGEFRCGSEEWEQDCTDFLFNDALNQQERALSRTYLFVDSSGHVLAYAAILASSLQRAPDGSLAGEKMPYPIAPAMLIGRIAVAERHQRRGIGKYVMSWLRNQARQLPVGCRFLILDVDVRNERAVAFYKSAGFFFPPHLEPRGNTQAMVFDLIA